MVLAETTVRWGCGISRLIPQSHMRASRSSFPLRGDRHPREEVPENCTWGRLGRFQDGPFTMEA